MGARVRTARNTINGGRMTEVVVYTQPNCQPCKATNEKETR